MRGQTSMRALEYSWRHTFPERAAARSRRGDLLLGIRGAPSGAIARVAVVDDGLHQQRDRARSRMARDHWHARGELEGNATEKKKGSSEEDDSESDESDSAAVKCSCS